MIERDRIKRSARIYSSNDDAGRAMGIAPALLAVVNGPVHVLVDIGHQAWALLQLLCNPIEVSGI
jgi:hypothetical protein